MFGAPNNKNHPNGVLSSKQALEIPIIGKQIRCGEEGWIESTGLGVAFFHGSP